MLIKVKNGDLYRAWIQYLEKLTGKPNTAIERTTAFFNSQKAIPVPLLR